MGLIRRTRIWKCVYSQQGFFDLLSTPSRCHFSQTYFCLGFWSIRFNFLNSYWWKRILHVIGARTTKALYFVLTDILFSANLRVSHSLLLYWTNNSTQFVNMEPELSRPFTQAHSLNKHVKNLPHIWPSVLIDAPYWLLPVQISKWLPVGSPGNLTPQQTQEGKPVALALYGIVSGASLCSKLCTKLRQTALNETLQTLGFPCWVQAVLLRNSNKEFLLISTGDLWFDSVWRTIRKLY